MSLSRTARAPPPCALNSIGYAPIRRKNSDPIVKIKFELKKKSYIVVFTVTKIV